MRPGADRGGACPRVVIARFAHLSGNDAVALVSLFRGLSFLAKDATMFNVAPPVMDACGFCDWDGHVSGDVRHSQSMASDRNGADFWSGRTCVCTCAGNEVLTEVVTDRQDLTH